MILYTWSKYDNHQDDRMLTECKRNTWEKYNLDMGSFQKPKWTKISAWNDKTSISIKLKQEKYRENKMK